MSFHSAGVSSKYLLLLFPLLFLTACNNSFVGPVGDELPFQNDTSSSPGIENVYPVPTETQLEWQDAELVMFIHFGMNTFTGRDIGDGNESPAFFSPSKVDVKQWVSVAKAAGFKYLILTAKHHDGFCLWPSQFTEHSVKNSPYKGGNGDIVKELADECALREIKFGFYLSMYDRNSSLYGTAAYNDYYRNQLTELLSNYGDIHEIWLDGYLGVNPTITHQMFDWLGFAELSKSLQRNSLMAIMGPDIRWVGNEDGLGSETDWSFTYSHPAHHGISNVDVWWPTECDVSIRPAWFYHDYDDGEVKSAAYLADLYLKSVGRNSQLLLNVPPTTGGVFHENDINSLLGFRRIIDDIFRTNLFLGAAATASNSRVEDTLFSPAMAIDGSRKTFWVPEHGVVRADLNVDLRGSKQINYFRIEEAIRYGQRVKGFEIEGFVNGVWVFLAEGTTIGRSRILKLDTPVEVSKVRLKIKDARGAPAIRLFGAYFYEN